MGRKRRKGKKGGREGGWEGKRKGARTRMRGKERGKERKKKEEKKREREKRRPRAVVYFLKIQILFRISRRREFLKTPQVILKFPATCREL